MLKRMISLMLAAVLMVTMLPLSVWAEDYTTGETLPEETVPETAVGETTEPTEETVPDVTLPAEEDQQEEAVSGTECTTVPTEEMPGPEENVTEPAETEPSTLPSEETPEETVEATEETVEEPTEATEETLPQDAYLGTAPEQFNTVIHSNSMLAAQAGGIYQSGGISGDLNARSHTKGQIQQMYYQLTYPSRIFDESPSVKSPYRAGKLSDSMLESGITMLNYVRYAANLPLVQLHSAMNEDAQHGAVVNAANDRLSHYPKRPSGMDTDFYEWGSYATSHSNLAYSYGYPDKSALQLAVLMFMDDDDAGNNDRVGHRRWLLNPHMANIGFGYAKAGSGSNYVAAEVFGCYSGEYITRSDVDYEYIAWPASGNFPSNLFGKAIPWSVSLNPAIYETPSVRDVQVTLTRQSDGRQWQMDVHSGSHTSPSGPYLVVDTGGYGISNCIIFHPKSSTIGSYDGIYTVDITGLRTVDGVPANLHYEVDFFNVDTYEAPPESIDGGSFGEALYWEYYPTGELVISGQGAMMDMDSSPWQQYISDISAVTIENGVTTIGGNAFAQCVRLTKIKIPDSVEKIGNRAFAGCTAVKELTLPIGVKILGDAVFAESSIKQLRFIGGFPELTESSLAGMDALVWYPGDDSSWAAAPLDGRYGGNIRWIAVYDSRYVYEITTSSTEMLAGQTITLNAQMAPGDEASGKIQWELLPEDAEKATLTGSGTSVKLKAADLTEKTTVTVTASMEQGNLPQSTLTLQLQPKVQVVQIFHEDKAVSGETLLFDLNREEKEGTPRWQMQLSAGILPEEAPQKIIWKSKNTEIAQVDSAGLVTFKGPEGSVVITAMADDGSKKSASVTIRASRLVRSVKIEGNSSVVGGSTQTLTAKNPESEANLTSSQVTWFLAEKDAPYASISNKGKLTTRAVAEKTEITVFCRVSGKEDEPAAFKVTIHPKTTLVKICESREEENTAAQKTVFFDLNEGSVSLKAVCYPEDGIDLPVDWTVNDAKKQAYAAYSVDPKTNILTIHSPTGKLGKITVKAAAQDGSKKNTAVTVQFGRFAKSLQITKSADTLHSGSSMELNAKILPENVTQNGVTWSLKNSADKAYASISSKGILRAKPVYAEQVVTVVAVSKDGRACDEETIRILPEDTGILVLHDASGKNVTKSTLAVDLNTTSRLTLTAHDFSDGQKTKVSWKSSENDIAVVENGTVTFKKSGSVRITATAENKRKASVTIKAAKLARQVEITSDTNFEVASGKSITLKARLVDAAANKVTWSISSGDAWVKITASGKLTAEKNLVSAKTVKVLATAADGSGQYAEKTVTVRPLTTAVQIYSVDESNGTMLLNVDSREMPEDWLGIVRTNTTFVWDMEKMPGLQLSAKTYPCADHERQAVQRVKWSSSSKQVAAIDENGWITCKKAGSTTITATAADGSGIKAAFKLTVVKRMTDLQLPAGKYVAGGKKLTIQPVISPADTTNKKLTWKVTGGNGAGYAWMSGNGVLNTRKVTAPKTVEITAFAQDGSGCAGKCTVTIYPATTAITLWRNGMNVTGKTVTAGPGELLSLSASCKPANAAGKYIWKSSNSRYASVDESGNVTLGDAIGKTVTITATASDGSGKKATVKIKISPQS